MLLTIFVTMFKNVYLFYLGMIVWLISLLNMSYPSSIYFMENSTFYGLCYLSILTGLFIQMSNINASSEKWVSMLILICFIFFMSSNLMILFILFELSLFPILMIIMMNGVQVERVSAMSFLMIYTTFCSLPLMFIIWSESNMGTYFNQMSWLASLICLLSFMTKIPIYLFHFWLPKAHVESPTFGSILLASLLLKLGTIGVLRMLWHMNSFNWSLLLSLGLFGMLFTSAICFWQSDLKSLIAYSSICHMSFCFTSMLMFNQSSMFGSVLMMIFHGTTSSLMFYIVGTMYHILNSRMIYYLNGMLKSNLLFSGLISLSLVLNFSVPPSSLFISEMFMISNLFFFIRMSMMIIGLYIMFVCYYSLYVVVNLLTGSSNSQVNWESFSMLSFMILSFSPMMINFILYFLKSLVSNSNVS